MKCGHCKTEQVDKAHVVRCAQSAGNPAGQTSADRHHNDRRALFAEINRIGAGVPAHHYALPNKVGGENDVSFYKIDRPDKGKYEGLTFVNQVLGGGFGSLLLPPARALDVIKRIAADPQTAMALYGHKIGQCGKCGLPLTNQASRERGIGPICARNLGWTDAA
jgi:hypothetical protein